MCIMINWKVSVSENSRKYLLVFMFRQSKLLLLEKVVQAPFTTQCLQHTKFTEKCYQNIKCSATNCENTNCNVTIFHPSQCFYLFELEITNLFDLDIRETNLLLLFCIRWEKVNSVDGTFKWTWYPHTLRRQAYTEYVSAIHCNELTAIPIIMLLLSVQYLQSS